MNGYLEDKLHKLQLSQYGESNCCRAPIIADYEICSDCQEHCEEYKNFCYGCEREIEDEELVCGSSECWDLYCSEHFNDDND